jgi:biopolymer transport protein ExbD
MLRKSQHKRKRLSMTSLIDVIFLLLLFFMLSSTFSRFAEVELQAASSGTTSQADKPKVAFLRSVKGEMSLNGTPLSLPELKKQVAAIHQKEPIVLLINLGADVTAQQMTDILVAVRSIPNLPVNVLGAG